MKKSFVEMSTYYRSSEHGLVRTICRVIDANTGEVMTAYVKVGERGCVSEVFIMPEMEFEATFIK